MKNITYETNEQLWKIENELKAQGYTKTNDCYWAQIFSNGQEEISAERQ